MSRLGLQFGTLEDSSQQHPYPEGSHNLLEQWSLGIKLQCENAVLIKNYRVLYTLKYSRPFIIGLQLLVQPFLDIYLSHKSDPPITSHSFIFCGYPDFFFGLKVFPYFASFTSDSDCESSSKSKFECLLCQEFHLPCALFRNTLFPLDIFHILNILRISSSVNCFLMSFIQVSLFLVCRVWLSVPISERPSEKPVDQTKLCVLVLLYKREHTLMVIS